MSNILVTVAETDTPVPAGQTFASLAVVNTDAAGAVQTVNVTAAPWTATFNGIADGAGSVTATALDSTGVTMGTPMTQTYSTSVTPPSTFPQPTSLTVSPA